MATAVSISSNALLSLGDKPIADFSEPTDRARLASNLYADVRDEVLRSHPWNCSIKRLQLAPSATKPTFEYSSAFDLPGDWLRTLSVENSGRVVEYASESRRILTNHNVIELRYIFRNDVESTWDSSLVGVMTKAMAAHMSYAITNSTSLRDSRMNEYMLALRNARAVDGQSDPPQSLSGSPFLDARY